MLDIDTDRTYIINLISNWIQSAVDRKLTLEKFQEEFERFRKERNEGIERGKDENIS